MHIIYAKTTENGWDLKAGEFSWIWKGGCIICAVFLDQVKKVYYMNLELVNMLVDIELSKEMVEIKVI